MESKSVNPKEYEDFKIWAIKHEWFHLKTIPENHEIWLSPSGHCYELGINK